MFWLRQLRIPKLLKNSYAHPKILFPGFLFWILQIYFLLGLLFQLSHIFFTAIEFVHLTYKHWDCSAPWYFHFTNNNKKEEFGAEGHIELRVASGVPVGVSSMAEDIRTKIKSYQTAPFDSRFPNQNQTRNCWQSYLDFPTVKGSDCWRGWCLHVQTVPACAQVPLPHILGVGLGWPLGRSMFPGKIWTGCTPPVLCLPSLS